MHAYKLTHATSIEATLYSDLEDVDHHGKPQVSVTYSFWHVMIIYTYPTITVITTVTIKAAPVQDVWSQIGGVLVSTLPCTVYICMHGINLLEPCIWMAVYNRWTGLDWTTGLTFLPRKLTKCNIFNS